MLFLASIGFLAGVVTSLSPCVLPVLPVILTAGVSGPRRGREGPRDGPERSRRRTRSGRAGRVVAGLVISFSLTTLFGSLLLTALHLPTDLLRNVGIAVLIVIGLGLLWPRLGELLERPFARLPQRGPGRDCNGLVLGLGLGLLFVPCAGPVLAAIVLLGATHQFSLQAFALTASFALGVGVPLLVLARGGQRISQRVRFLSEHARTLRAASGIIMILVAVLIGLHLTDPLSRQLPSYAEAMQKAVGGTPYVSGLLRGLAPGIKSPQLNTAPACNDGEQPTLVDCGPAPELSGITGWLPTPGAAPPSIASLRGKVVLLDFWTYSCINCQRTLPHLEAWYRTYKSAGLVIVGVHTPEFAFEYEPANVAAQARALGVQYPVAIDDSYAAWTAYGSEGWPSDYLIDRTGTIRHIATGEGHYALTEKLIRQLLAEHNPKAALPPPTEIPDTTPVGSRLTQETYLGHSHALHVSGTMPTRNVPGTYRLPATVVAGTFALGGTWTDSEQALTAGPDARLLLNCQANNVYLVLAGQGSVTLKVKVKGRPDAVIAVSGVPKLYPLVTGAGDSTMLLDLTLSPGLQAYDFTFG